jgi:Family of unknown function (DUF5309)
MASPPTMGSAPSNTYTQAGASGTVHEDVSDIINRIDPETTPFYSSLGTDEASQTLHEWLVQELNTAADVPQPEGFTAVMSPAKKPARLGNITQILARTVAVSGTLRAVDSIGGEDEYNRQLVLRGIELRRDLELVMLSATPKAATDPRHMAGLPTFCTNGSRGAGAGVMPVGDGTNAGTAGTARDLTLDMVNNAMQQAWTQGGEPTFGVMSGNIKNYFATLSQGGTGNPIAAQNIVQASPTGQLTIQGAVDVYRTNFGTLQLAPDRFMPANNILIVDKNYVAYSPLPGRNFLHQTYAQTGDNSQGGVLLEATLTVSAPKAHAWIADLNQ